MMSNIAAETQYIAHTLRGQSVDPGDAFLQGIALVLEIERRHTVEPAAHHIASAA